MSRETARASGRGGAGAPPPGVAERLRALRALCVPERDAEARARLARERPPARQRSFEAAVAERLRELRALCDLAHHLHQGRPARTK